MPSAFSQHAAKLIKAKLRSSGRALFAGQGVHKTSIEQLTKAAGIAKGSFYKFYESKELLFFELLEEAQNEIRAPLIVRDTPRKTKTRKHFESLIRALFRDISNEPLVQFMARESEMMALARKLPPEKLKRHQNADQKFMKQLVEIWNMKPQPPKQDVVGSRISILLLISFNREFLGDRLLPHALDAAVSSLADCFFGNAHKARK